MSEAVGEKPSVDDKESARRILGVSSSRWRHALQRKCAVSSALSSAIIYWSFTVAI
jgi:hypothetical protein